MPAALHRWGPRLLDVAGYAVGLTGAVVVALAPVSLLAGAGLNGVKVGLFVVGTLAFGYATYLLWPARPDVAAAGHDDGQLASRGDGGADPDARGGPRTETPFESLLSRVPLLRRTGVPPAARLPPGAKLYVASLLMLAVSYGMEALLGVRG